MFLHMYIYNVNIMFSVYVRIYTNKHKLLYLYIDIYCVYIFTRLFNSINTSFWQIVCACLIKVNLLYLTFIYSPKELILLDFNSYIAG